jgi:hypothetical protein
VERAVLEAVVFEADGAIVVSVMPTTPERDR